MKKMVCSLVIVMVVLLNIPQISFAAADKLTPVLIGMTGYSSDKKTQVKFITDGDSTTFHTMDRNNQIQIDYFFPEGKVINAFKLNADPNTFSIYFYDKDGNRLKGIQTNKIPINQLSMLDVPVENVFKVGIRFESMYSSDTSKVYDFEVYSSDTDIVPPLKPTGLTSSGSNGVIHLLWNKNLEGDLSHYNVYLSDGTKINSSPVIHNSFDYPSENDLEKSFYITAVDSSGNESVYSDVVKGMAAKRPPQQPQQFKAVETKVTDSKAVSLSWVKGMDATGYNLYVSQDNVSFEKVETDPLTSSLYTYAKVEENKQYYFKLEAINDDGVSVPAFTTVTISGPLPSKVAKVSIVVRNGGLNVSWLPLTIGFVNSYNVYLDGVKFANTNSTSLLIDKLQNGRTYTIQVAAVNDMGQGEISDKVSGTPSAASLPDLSLGYDLKDIVTGTSSWFSSIWLVLAFVVAIPLSFYVGNRIKGLFTD